MKIGNRLPVLAAAVLLVGMLVSPRAQSQSDAAAVPIGAKDIGGVVSSPQGHEAGVWVIAESTELPTQFRRIVVTDDQGRYLVPDRHPARLADHHQEPSLCRLPPARTGINAHERSRAPRRCNRLAAGFSGKSFVVGGDAVFAAEFLLVRDRFVR